MLELKLEPEVEKFFDYSTTKIIKTLNFVANNKINFKQIDLSDTQKQELQNRINDFNQNPNIGTDWQDVKKQLNIK